MTKPLKLFCFLFLLQVINAGAQNKYVVLSPDKTVSVTLSVSDSIRYTLSADAKDLAASSAISFKTDGDKTAVWKVVRSKTTSGNVVLSPLVCQKNSKVNDVYNQLHLDFSNGLSLEWRAYNNGVAWHWLTGNKGAYKVLDEQAAFNFGDNSRTWFPQEDGFYSHNERNYHNYSLAEVDEQKLASLPALFEVKGIKLLLTESNLLNYAGMWIRGGNNGTIKAVFPHYPKTTSVTSDRDEQVVSREDFIAKNNGPQSFPWRVLMIARNDNDLLVNQLVYQLAQPSSGDFSWVKPGKVSWDWWNDNNIYGVDFRAGINTATYKYYIDFAAKYGLKYIILDEGWSDTKDLLKVVPEIDMEALTTYASQKGVGVILWASWLALKDEKLIPVLDQFEKWGIKGIKVDFMQRDDQVMVNYYVRVSEEALKRKMLVDFHGAYKPTGLYRTYPNVLTSEGVYGMEQSKGDGSKKIGPDHNVTIPFIRMAAGPMDYTPGAMLNAQKDAWRAIGSEPMSLGTRCHQLAMYVVFESPLQMLADNPTHYYKEPECMEFLQSVPVEWDTTVPLSSKVGNYISVARKAKNGDWYVGAMTDWTARSLPVDLSFLGEGTYTMRVWKDGINADRNAKDFKTEKIAVDQNSHVSINMSNGGGWVAIISKDNK